MVGIVLFSRTLFETQSFVHEICVGEKTLPDYQQLDFVNIAFRELGKFRVSPSNTKIP